MLTIRIQPDEGIALKLGARAPGPAMYIRQMLMNFSYGDAFGEFPATAYETLLLDAMLGDLTLFNRRDARRPVVADPRTGDRQLAGDARDLGVVSELRGWNVGTCRRRRAPRARRTQLEEHGKPGPLRCDRCVVRPVRGQQSASEGDGRP